MNAADASQTPRPKHHAVLEVALAPAPVTPRILEHSLRAFLVASLQVVGHPNLPILPEHQGGFDEIMRALKERPAIEFASDWQMIVAKLVGLVPQSAFESFIDVDGEFLLERLQSLVNNALERRLPVLFQ